MRDGRQLNECFSGTVMANEVVQLASPNGVQLYGTSPRRLHRHYHALERNTVGFEAPLRMGIDGFYPVNITSEGR